MTEHKGVYERTHHAHQFSLRYQKSDGQELQVKNNNVYNLNLMYLDVSITMCHRQ